MISIKIFCEATAAELHDPSVRWDYYPISYLRSYLRCKEFKSKIPLLADLNWGESDMKFLITSIPLDIILLFLKEFNSRLDFYDRFDSHIYSDDNFVIRTFDPVKLLQILSHGFPVEYIDWAEVPFDHPSLIFVLEKYIKKAIYGSEIDLK